MCHFRNRRITENSVGMEKAKPLWVESKAAFILIPPTDQAESEVFVCDYEFVILPILEQLFDFVLPQSVGEGFPQKLLFWS